MLTNTCKLLTLIQVLELYKSLLWSYSLLLIPFISSNHNENSIIRWVSNPLHEKSYFSFTYPQSKTGGPLTEITSPGLTYSCFSLTVFSHVAQKGCCHQQETWSVVFCIKTGKKTPLTPIIQIPSRSTFIKKEGKVHWLESFSRGSLLFTLWTGKV